MDTQHLPTRKPTRLQGYDYSENGAYFVTVCTENRQKILSTVVGGGALDAPTIQLTNVGKIAERYLLSTNNIESVSIDRYVIMPDHIHFIVFIKKNPDNGTSKAPSPTNQMIPHIVSTFKRFCHRAIGCTIFQRSYYDHIIRSNEDYLEKVAYIEQNPAKWWERHT